MVTEKVVAVNWPKRLLLILIAGISRGRRWDAAGASCTRAQEALAEQ